MRDLNLHLFEGGHSVTLYYDSGVTAASASASSDVAANTEVTLTVTLATGKEIDEYEVIAGGVTVNASTKKFTMKTADVVIYIKTKAKNTYMVTEEAMVNVNDTKVILHKNAKVICTPNGVPKAVEAEEGGTTVTLNDAVQSLIDQGVLVPI